MLVSVTKALLMIAVLGAGIFSIPATYDLVNERRQTIPLNAPSDSGLAVGMRAAAILTPALGEAIGQQTGEGVSEEMRKAIAIETRRGILREPLNPDGLRALAVVAKLEDREEESFRLLKLSERVSRRDAKTGLLLSLAYAEQEDVEAMLSTIDNAMRGSVQIRETMLPQLMGLLGYEQAVTLVADLLAGSPPWEEDFWEASAEAPTPSLTNLARIRIARSQDGYVGKPILDRRLLAAITDAGEFNTALALYAELFAVDLDRLELVNNAGFDQAPRDPPFDWELKFGNSLSTDILPADGTLRIQTFGGGSGVAARQLVSLPGSVATLNIQAKEWDNRDGQTLYARISCAEGGDSSVTLDLRSAKASIPLSRPKADCRFNWLELVVRPQDDRRDNSVLLDSVSILAGPSR